MTASSDIGSAQPELLVPPVPTPAPDVKGPGQSSQLLTWLGVAPFFIFALLFLILPTGFLMVGAFQDPQGHFTLVNFLDLFQPGVLDAYWISFKVSAASAIGGAVIGSLLAWAAVQGRLPVWIRPTLMTFSGVASNFAGVPLAFAFICTLGRVGLVTASICTRRASAFSVSPV
jgi:putative spermidine/putrescine transport system permease protein